MTLTQLAPFTNALAAGITVVEKYLAAIVVTIAQNVAAERALALSAVGLYQIMMASLKAHILLPDVRNKSSLPHSVIG